ncbi:MAG TPA: glucose-1-phosphate thymidylyltransferase [Candidatus Dormibacteraeota bacterium]
MKGLILSGGRGTRLRPLTYTSAKQLIPIANRPILFYAIDALAAAGVTDIGVVTGETGPEVEAAVGDGSRFGVHITYIPQGAPLGLAHAVQVSQPFLGDSDFVMYLGDNLVRRGIVPIVDTFKSSGPDALILLARVAEPRQFGVAEFENGRLCRLVEKPQATTSDLALVGVYVFTKSVFAAIDAIEFSARGELEITDAIQRMIDTGRRVDAHVITEPHQARVATWKDTGRLEDVLEANRLVLDEIAPKIDIAIPDGVRVEGKVVIEPGAQLCDCVVRGPAIIGMGARIESAFIGPYTAVSDQCVVRNAELENSILLHGSVVEDVDGRIDSSLIGKGCVVRRTQARPKTHKLLLGDQSCVEMS